MNRIKDLRLRRSVIWAAALLVFAFVLAQPDKALAQGQWVGGVLTSAARAIKSHQEMLQAQTAAKKSKAGQEELSPSAAGGDPSPQSSKSGKNPSGGQEHIDVAGTGTQNKIAKWMDATGTLGDSAIFETGGNVGIGTMSPAALLHARGASAGYHLQLDGTTAGGNVWMKVGNTTRSYLVGMRGDESDNFVLYDNTNGTDRLVINSSGNVGIGMIGPGAKLEVNGTGIYQDLLRIQGNSNVPSGANGIGLELFQYAGNSYVQSFNRSTTTYTPLYFESSKSIFENGNVGIGATNPTSRLVVGGDGQQTELQGDLLLSRSAAPPYIYNNHPTNNLNIRTGGTGRLMFQPDTGTGNVDFFNGKVVVQSSGNVGIGTTSPQYTLDVAGNVNASGTISGGNVIAKYQDVAEWVPASRSISAGTVVVLDIDQSNHVLPSAHAYDTRVAGVVSEKPGVILGEGGNGKVMVATTGRVKIKVDATAAPIRVGDLLVTSDKEGLAMRSQPLDFGGTPIHRPGTLIGKALEPLEKGVGEILVLLSLQ